MRPLQVAVSLFALLALATPALADEGRRELTMTGTGEVTAAPDMASVDIGVTTEAASARAALDANTGAMANVMKSLDGHGIANKDIRTSGFNVQPRYRHDPARPEAPQITGYQVTNTVHVAVRDLARLGDLLDVVVSQGSNSISGLTFGFAEPEKLTDEARRAAGVDAKRKARLYAEALGIELGAIVTVSEAGGGPIPVPIMARTMALEAGPVPIAAGEQTVRASVTVTWEIE